MWLREAKRKGLCFYVSKETIGKVDMGESSWFTGYDEKFFFGKGACCAAMYGQWAGLWSEYYLLRYRNSGQLLMKQKRKWMRLGRQGYQKMQGYQEYTGK